MQAFPKDAHEQKQWSETGLMDEAQKQWSNKRATRPMRAPWGSNFCSDFLYVLGPVTFLPPRCALDRHRLGQVLQGSLSLCVQGVTFAEREKMLQKCGQTVRAIPAEMLSLVDSVLPVPWEIQAARDVAPDVAPDTAPRLSSSPAGPSGAPP